MRLKVDKGNGVLYFRLDESDPCNLFSDAIYLLVDKGLSLYDLTVSCVQHQISMAV